MPISPKEFIVLSLKPASVSLGQSMSRVPSSAGHHPLVSHELEQEWDGGKELGSIKKELATEIDRSANKNTCHQP